MEGLSNKTLAVFHSYKMSFATWKAAGILERELLLYRALRPHFKKIIFVTYASDIRAEQALAGEHFTVVSHKNKNALKEADILRVNQMSGMLAAGGVKKMFPEKKLAVRCGFMWSLFQKHGNIFKKWYVSRLERWAFSAADSIVLTSRADARYIESRYGRQEAPVTIIRNLIDTAVFAPSGLKRIKSKLCAVGRLEPQKNYESLIRAIEGSPYELHIFGQGTLRLELEKLATSLKVKVLFNGIVPNVELAREIDSCDLFVLASQYEGNPKSLLEAMSAGLPVVASNIEAHKDIILDGENGFLCESSPEALRTAIDRITADESLAKKLGESARKWVVANCGLEKILKQELELYESL